MVCIYCNNKTQVTNSRSQKRTNTIWRRRQCLECQAIVSTIETMDLSTAIIVTDKNAHNPFTRDKLFITIYDSCKHRKSAQEDATSLTDTIIKLIQPQIMHATISKELIKNTSYKVLSNFDQAAAVQYKAFHP